MPAHQSGHGCGDGARRGLVNRPEVRLTAGSERGLARDPRSLGSWRRSRQCRSARHPDQGAAPSVQGQEAEPTAGPGWDGGAAGRQLGENGVTGHCPPGPGAAAAAHPVRAGAATGPQPARPAVAGRCPWLHDGDAGRCCPGLGAAAGSQPATLGMAGRCRPDQDDAAAGLPPDRGAAAAAHRNQAGRPVGRRPGPGRATVNRGLPDGSLGQPCQAACPGCAASSGRSAGTSWSRLRHTNAATVMTRNISVGIQP